MKKKEDRKLSKDIREIKLPHETLALTKLALTKLALNELLLIGTRTAEADL